MTGRVKKKTAFRTEDRKDEFVYTRIEPELLVKIEQIQNQRKVKSRSEVIRAMLWWSLENGVLES